MNKRQEAAKLGHKNRGKRFYPVCISCGEIYEVVPCQVGKITCCSKTCRTEFKKTVFTERRRVVSGNGHHNWQGGVTSQSKLDRQRFYKKFAPQVIDRDGYSCTNCNASDRELHVHHIKSWSNHPELRFKLENCQTLCNGYHYEETWGKPKPKHKLFGRNLWSMRRAS